MDVCTCKHMYMSVRLYARLNEGGNCILYNVNAFIHMTIYEEVCKGVCAFFFPHSVTDTPAVLLVFLYFMYEMLIIVS